ncbi:hypothetical protein UJ101_00281 [Flavobacteriaceae bacterium UJ101]|nr:hypothetical protein UJ101_00281 [Flavobacteriaceae bacterium UJ101]
MKKISMALVGIGVCLSGVLFAQDTNTANHNVIIKIPNLAILDLETTSSLDINLAGTNPTEAGLPIDFTNGTNSDLWLNYSSVIGSGVTSRNVKVKYTGTMPDGLALSVVAASDAGGGAGNFGTPAAKFELTETDQDIITSVGSCYTGDGANKGHNLTYSLDLASGADYGDIRVDEAGETLVVTYTFIDS